MNTSDQVPTPADPRAPLWRMVFSPYGALFTKFIGWSLLVGALAGVSGLAPLLDPLLAAPRFSEFLLLLFGLYMAVVLVSGTVASSAAGKLLGARYSSVWIPIQMVICAGLLIPTPMGSSLLAAMVAWVMHLVAEV